MTLPGYYSEGGTVAVYGRWRLATSLIVLAREIAAVYPEATCLGTGPNAEHIAQRSASDHNPWIKGPDGLGVCRAIDIGGPDSMLMSIREHIWTLYAAQDPRVYIEGYAKGCSDNLINNRGLPFGTHVDLGDAGHLHISVSRSGSNYIPAIDSASSWGFGSSPLGGGTQLEDDMDPAQFAQMMGALDGINSGVAELVRQGRVQMGVLTPAGNEHSQYALVAPLLAGIDASIKAIPGGSGGPSGAPSANDNAKATVAELGRVLGGQP